MDKDDHINGVRQAIESIAQSVTGVDYALSGPDSCSPVGESIEILAKEVKRLGRGDQEPGALEAVGIALAGQFMNYPIGPALERNAEANHRIADALESIAQAISEKE